MPNYFQWDNKNIILIFKINKQKNCFPLKKSTTIISRLSNFVKKKKYDIQQCKKKNLKTHFNKKSTAVNNKKY